MKHRTLAIAIVSLVLVVLMALVAAGCSRDSGGTGVEIKPTWIAAQVEGEQVSISKSEIDDGQMVHFRVEEQGEKMVFMAYRLGERDLPQGQYLSAMPVREFLASRRHPGLQYLWHQIPGGHGRRDLRCLQGLPQG